MIRLLLIRHVFHSVLTLGPRVTAFYTSDKPEVVDMKTKVNIFCWHFSSREPMEAGISACTRSNRWKLVSVQRAKKTLVELKKRDVTFQGGQYVTQLT